MKHTPLAVNLARHVIDKHGADADKPSVHLAKAVIAYAHEIDRLRELVRAIPTWTKHGPAGSGYAGPCAEGCLKCRAEAELARSLP